MPARQQQSGFALLIFMVILIGMGGLVVEGYMQNIAKSVEAKKYQKNKEVLKQAKQALLMYAYNYPANNPGFGPGRLPCPDTDNNGSPNPSFFCINGNAIVGRFPWNAPGMDFYDARDSSGERLWYAVSRNFANTGPVSINSDTLGTITLVDQAGATIYDSTVAGIAAVIIAPGSTINAQDRRIANGDNPFDLIPDTDPGIISPANYLDSFNGFDNSSFVNFGNAVAEGFILGPVFDGTQNTYVVNDQMVYITADEVIEKAEAAVLQSYKLALEDYQSTLWTLPSAYRYPWLNRYSDILNLDEYKPAINATTGRIPSIFSGYFIDQNSESVFSKIYLDYNVSITIDEDSTDDMDIFDATYAHTDTLIGEANVAFNDTNTGRIVGVSGSTVSGDYTGPTYYFWDELLAPDGWELCPVITGDERDCNQTTAGVFVSDPTIDLNMVHNRIRKLTLKTGFNSGFTFQVNYSPQPTIAYSLPSVTSHAKISANFTNPGNVTLVDGFVYYHYEQDDDYLNSFVDDSSGEIPVNSSYTLTFNQFDITLDYFPVLPKWAGKDKDNWNSSVMMTYASDYGPGGGAACTAGTDCLTLNNSGGINNNKISLLAIAGLIPVDSADLENIFEGENNAPDEDRNSTLNTIFDASPLGSDDKILVLDEN